MWLRVVISPKNLGLYMSTIHVITVTFFTFFTFFLIPKTWLFAFFCFASYVFSNYDNGSQLLFIGNRVRAFDWYWHRWPWTNTPFLRITLSWASYFNNNIVNSTRTYCDLSSLLVGWFVRVSGVAGAHEKDVRKNISGEGHTACGEYTEGECGRLAEVVLYQYFVYVKLLSRVG